MRFIQNRKIVDSNVMEDKQVVWLLEDKQNMCRLYQELFPASPVWFVSVQEQSLPVTVLWVYMGKGKVTIQWLNNPSLWCPYLAVVRGKFKTKIHSKLFTKLNGPCFPQFFTQKRTLVIFAPTNHITFFWSWKDEKTIFRCCGGLQSKGYKIMSRFSIVLYHKPLDTSSCFVWKCIVCLKT